MERIHVVGAGARSGTTLLTECLIASFDIDAYEKHEAQINRHRTGADVYLTKWPTDTAVVGPRLTLDRHFHVLCMVRDPRDVIVSFHSKDPGRYWTDLSLWKSQYRHVTRLRDHERFTVVKYEDLVSDPDGVQDLIQARLPFLRRTAAFSSFHERAAPSPGAVSALGGVRPISTVSTGNWRGHLPRVAGQIELYGPIASELVELGYEKDDAWLSVLNGVTPDIDPGHRERRRKSIAVRQVRAAVDAACVVSARLFGSKIV